VGATLTNAGTQAALVIDGVTVSVADRVLVYQQTTQTQNGIYVVTNVGSGSTNWILTRSSDADTYVINNAAGLSEGSTVFVQQGATGAGETYTCNTTGVITFGTTNITFAQISSAQIYSAGTGLTLSGTQYCWHIRRCRYGAGNHHERTGPSHKRHAHGHHYHRRSGLGQHLWLCWLGGQRPDGGHVPDFWRHV
jgi:hypothetical protein